MRSFLLDAMAVLCFVAWTGVASAEPVLEPRYAVKLAPEPFVVSPELAHGPSPHDEALRSELRHARGMLMVGSGVLAAAAIHMAVLGRPTYCHAYEDPVSRLKTPLIAGPVAAGLGIGLLVGGGIKLLRGPTDYRHTHRPGGWRIMSLVFGAIASAAATSALLYAVAAPEIISCD